MSPSQLSRLELSDPRTKPQEFQPIVFVAKYQAIMFCLQICSGRQDRGTGQHTYRLFR